MIAERLVEQSESLSPGEILSGIYGLAKFHFQDDSGKVLGILASRARRQIYNFSLDDCAQILASLSRVGHKNQALITRVQERIITEGLDGCSSRSVVNLMTAFARFGVASSRKLDAWPLLAETLASRIECDSASLSRSDVLAAIVSYSFPHIGRAHDGLFSAASRFLASQPDSFTLTDVRRYVKAASRCQYRNLDTLASCATWVRADLEGLEKLEKGAFLELFNGLEKLGVEIKEINAELARRGIEVPRSSDPTWFRQPAPRPVTKKITKESRSLRRRKWTW